MMTTPLYDTPADVVAKALRGLDLSPAEAADRAGIPRAELLAFLGGGTSTELALRLAPCLGLAPEALASLPGYQPRFPSVPGLARLELPFDDETVNAWLLESQGVALVIDAGLGARDLASALDRRGVHRCHLLVTHGHRDHLGGIAAIRERLDSLHSPTAAEGSAPVKPGEVLQLGPFSIEARDLRGHHPHALGYRIDGLERVVFAVGDAIFAGSMGGCPGPSAYAEALQSARESVLTLPPETLLLPGHGPGTTLGQELEHNAFLAALSH